MVTKEKLLEILKQKDLSDPRLYHYINDTKLMSSIMKHTNFLGELSKYRERVHCLINDIDSTPICRVCGNNGAVFKRTESKDEYGNRARTYGYQPCSKECSKKYRSQKVSKSLQEKDDEYYKNRSIKAIQNYIDSSKNNQFFHKLSEIYDSITLAQCKWHGENELKIQYCICGEPAAWGGKGYKTCSKKCLNKKSAITRSKLVKSGIIKMPTNKKPKKAKKKKLSLSHSLRISHIKKLVGVIKSMGGYIHKTFDIKHNEFTIVHEKCRTTFTIDRNLLTSRMWRKHEICTNCNQRFSGNSSAEMNLVDFIKDNYNGEIILNSRSIIKPYEIDIYLPDINVAFEYNGLYWHSDEFMEPSKHRLKTQMCDKIGVRLIHVWEHHWLEFNDITKSIISSILSKSTKLYARKLKVITPSTKQVWEFLDNNHLQSRLWYTIAMALCDDSGEIVQLMTLNKHNGHLVKPDWWEVGRLATKLGYSVTGGAERLFKHLTKNLSSGTRIITYSDASIFTGKVYERLGFIRLGSTEPGYFYHKNGIILSRHQCQKHKLVEMGYDENTTEKEIMKSRGFHRVYNCGNHKFEIIIST